MGLYETLIDILRESAELLTDPRDRRLAENQLEQKDGKLHTYLAHSAEECVQGEYLPADAQRCIDTIAECLAQIAQDNHVQYMRYIQNRCFRAWVRAAEEVIKQHTGVMVEASPEEMECFENQPDKNIKLMKLLHPPGRTKAEIAAELEIGERSVQDRLSAMNLEGNPDRGMVYFAGQPVRVPIQTERIRTDLNKKKNTLRYVTPNTVHPIGLQLNITQLLSLFQALNLYRMQNQNIGDDVAKDIWVQLSEYGQRKLLELAKDRNIQRLLNLGTNDNMDSLENYFYNLQSELEEIGGDQWMENPFRTERELVTADQCSKEEKLFLLYKARRKCNISIRKDGKRIEYTAQIILGFKEKGQIAFAPDESSEPYVYAMDEVYDASLCV